jgi:NitT/TauT family transport system substrate-binding protein
MTAGRATIGSTDMHMLLAQRRQPGGLKARAVYSYLPSGIFRIAMVDEIPIKAPADLKGKKVGVPTRASGAFDFVRTVAKLAGVQEADMEIIPVGFGPAAADAVIRGRIDVLSTTFSDFNNLRYLSEIRRQFKMREMKVPQNAYPANAFIVTDDDMRNKRQLIIGMLRAFAKGHVFFVENPRAALAVARKLYPELVRDDDVERQIAIARWGIEDIYDLPKYRNKPLGYFDMEAWAGTEEYYRSAGLIEADDRIKDVIDTSLLDEVNDFDRERIRKMAREYK